MNTGNRKVPIQYGRQTGLVGYDRALVYVEDDELSFEEVRALLWKRNHPDGQFRKPMTTGMPTVFGERIAGKTTSQTGTRAPIVPIAAPATSENAIPPPSSTMQRAPFQPVVRPQIISMPLANNSILANHLDTFSFQDLNSPSPTICTRKALAAVMGMFKEPLPDEITDGDISLSRQQTLTTKTRDDDDDVEPIASTGAVSFTPFVDETTANISIALNSLPPPPPPQKPKPRTITSLTPACTQLSNLTTRVVEMPGYVSLERQGELHPERSEFVVGESLRFGGNSFVLNRSHNAAGAGGVGEAIWTVEDMNTQMLDMATSDDLVMAPTFILRAFLPAPSAFWDFFVLNRLVSSLDSFPDGKSNFVSPYRLYSFTNNMCIMMTHDSGESSLQDLIHAHATKKIPVDESMALFYASKILKALSWMFGAGFVHCSLSPSCILMRNDGDDETVSGVKLGMFRHALDLGDYGQNAFFGGLSGEEEEGSTASVILSRTPRYLVCDRSWLFEPDCYGVCDVFWQLLTGSKIPSTSSSEEYLSWMSVNLPKSTSRHSSLWMAIFESLSSLSEEVLKASMGDYRSYHEIASEIVGKLANECDEVLSSRDVQRSIRSSMAKQSILLYEVMDKI